MNLLPSPKAVRIAHFQIHCVSLVINLHTLISIFVCKRTRSLLLCSSRRGIYICHDISLLVTYLSFIIYHFEFQLFICKPKFVSKYLVDGMYGAQQAQGQMGMPNQQQWNPSLVPTRVTLAGTTPSNNFDARVPSLRITRSPHSPQAPSQGRPIGSFARYDSDPA